MIENQKLFFLRSVKIAVDDVINRALLTVKFVVRLGAVPSTAPSALGSQSLASLSNKKQHTIG